MSFNKGSIITSVLFLTVISLAIGDQRADVLGVPYIEFLANGLIITSVFLFNNHIFF